MSHAATTPPPPPPGRLSLPLPVRAVALLAAIAGAATFAWTLSRGEAALAWSAYLIGAFFTLGLALFAISWLAILALSRGTWAVTLRRPTEAMTTWLLPGGLLTLGIGFGLRALFHWADAEAVAADPLLTHKSPFLNPTLFWIVVAGSLVVWIAFGAAFVRLSRRQDREGGITASLRTRTLGAIFLVIFALSFSVVSFYLLLSLDAHWFSTMWAALVFTDVAQTGTAFLAVVAGLLVARGRLAGFLNENHLHALGKMLFAWTGFWAYIYFCQYLLIWYANIPEETVYFLRRTTESWLPHLLVVTLLKFVIPFLLLLPRAAKRNPRILVPTAMLLLLGQFMELYVMVGPALGHGAEPAPGHLPGVELLVTLGFLGLFTLVWGWSLARHEAVPLKEPALAACLDYHS